MASSTAASKRSRRRFLELACICFAVALLGWIVFPKMDVLVRADLAVQDKLAALRTPRSLADEFVFVAIDDVSMKLDQLWPEDIAASPALQEMQKGWPWPRSVYAAGIERILQAGAKVVLVDLILDKPRAGDAELKRVLDTYPRQIVLGANFSTDSISPDHPDVTSTVPAVPATTLLDDGLHDPRVGFVNFWPTALDRVVRAAPYGIDRFGHCDSLSAAGLRFLGKSDLIPASNVTHAFRFADQSTLRTVSFASLFIPMDWQKTLRNGAVFKDRIVLVGPSAAILHDEQIVPAREGNRIVPGPILHINAMSAALHGDFYKRYSPLVRFLSVALAALVALVIAARIRHPLSAVGAVLLVCAAYLLTSGGVSLLDYLLPVVQPGIVLFTAGVSCIAWNFTQARRESGRMRSTLERYVSRNVVREILDNQDDFLTALGGTRKPMTVFFSDVRGFTSFVERESEHAVVSQLNEYLAEMVGIIFRHNGTVDKFMGDGIMAVWGNVVSESIAKDAERAVTAALEMFDHLATLNEDWTKRGLSPFAIGIGLHHGEAVFGNIGSSEKMEPTVIGDTVNLASRVEGLTKKYGVPLCITQPLAELISDKFLLRSVDLVQVVGKSRPVEIFTILGKRGEEPPKWLKRYEGAIADFRARRFAEAVAELLVCKQLIPSDKLCAIYIDRAEAFLANPPPDDWTGAEIATSK
ncbi:MAG: CHASE2 domain-containing protein [Chthoniobacterales bacterium]